MRGARGRGRRGASAGDDVGPVEPKWTEIDRGFAELLVGDDPLLDAALEAAVDAGLPKHEVSPLQGKLLFLLARATNARRILELGTLGAYSTIWLARALPDDGRVTTIEVDARFAQVARKNLERAGQSDRVEVLEGDARDVLPTLEGPFDLVFIDADKRSNPVYLDHALALSRPGTLIVADNVVRDEADPHAEGIREFTRKLSDNPRVEATAIQTVGVKGHDGFVVALVTGD